MKPTHCPGQTDEEYRTEAATYAISASPMMIGTDIRLMTKVMNFTILNPELIGISQDPSGVAGFQTTSCGRPAWVRRLTEVGGSGARMAVAVPNLDDREAALVSGRSDLPTSPHLGLGKDSDVSVCLQDIGWVGDTAYAHDVWTHSSLGVINITTPLVRKLKSHDTVLIILSEHPLPTPPPTPTPPPSPHCSIALTKQTSRHECKLGSSYGCDDGAEKTMWVDGGCAGIFTCDGVANVACASQGEKRMTCKCAAAASVKELLLIRFTAPIVMLMASPRDHRCERSTPPRRAFGLSSRPPRESTLPSSSSPARTKSEPRRRCRSDREMAAHTGAA